MKNEKKYSTFIETLKALYHSKGLAKPITPIKLREMKAAKTISEEEYNYIIEEDEAKS